MSSRREGSSISQTGFRHEISQPGTATPTKLRYLTTHGLGEANAMAHLVTRMMRTEREGKRPDPRVTSVEDVTRDLGLIDTDAAKIQNVLRSTRADYGLHPQLRVPRLPAARKALSEVLRQLDGVDSWIRQEIQRRALKWWRTQQVDYQQIPTIRHTVRKSLIKAKKQDKKKDKKPKIRMDVKDHPETENGSQVEFHDDVTADLPGDADFQHHATEQAKHAAGYLVHKDQDPERAEAHLQAANLHARIGNALHATGNAQNGGDLEGGEEQDQPGNMGQNGDDQNQGNQPNQGQDQNQGQEKGALESIHPYQGQKNGSGGKDISGKDLPAKPDNKRNPPGRDSELQVQRRYSGKDERGKTTDPSKDRSAGVMINIANKSQVYTLRKSTYKFPHVIPLEKAGARGGKYISRKPKPGGGYTYEYPEEHKKEVKAKKAVKLGEAEFQALHGSNPDIPANVGGGVLDKEKVPYKVMLSLERKGLINVTTGAGGFTYRITEKGLKSYKKEKANRPRLLEAERKQDTAFKEKIAAMRARRLAQYTPEQLAAEEERVDRMMRRMQLEVEYEKRKKEQG